MQFYYTKSFQSSFKKLPKPIQKIVFFKLEMLLKNFLHPSLRAKKVQGTGGKIYEASIAISYWFTFEIHEDGYLLRHIGPHDILRDP